MHLSHNAILANLGRGRLPQRIRAWWTGLGSGWSIRGKVSEGAKV